MKSFYILFILGVVMAVFGCTDRVSEGDMSAIDKSQNAPGDSTIYGLVCDGTSDSTLVFLPNAGGDPITYNIIKATQKKLVFGTPEIGDWIGILVNPKKKNEAILVVDLDQLKGTWTYQVMPELKESATKTKEQIEAELTDSMRAILFVPREYGFTLKRHGQASTVGHIFKGNSLTDESLVEYPPVRNYTGWHVFNGKLILVRDTMDMNMKRIPADKVQQDTALFVYMKTDSLALMGKNKITGFHRRANAHIANERAQKAAQKEAIADTIKE